MDLDFDNDSIYREIVNEKYLDKHASLYHKKQEDESNSSLKIMLLILIILIAIMIMIHHHYFKMK